MSYDKNVNDHIVKFKDEKSYLNCRLDYLDYGGHTTPGFEISFLVYIQHDLYDEEKCEVESIELIQYTSISSDSSQGFYNGIIEDFNIVHGTLTMGGNSAISNSFINGGINSTIPSFPQIIPLAPLISYKEEPEEIKEEELVDPIDNRFDILDL